MAIYQETTRQKAAFIPVTTRSTFALLLIALLTTAALVVSGCVEEPSPVGSRLIPDSDLLRIDTASARSVGSSNGVRIPGPSPIRWIVGQANGVEAWGLVRFLTLPDTFRNVTILGAELRVRVNYHIGEPAGTWSVAIHRILQHWGVDSLTIDSVKAAGFYELAPRSSFSASAIADTADLFLPLDINLVHRWLDPSIDTTFQNHGILLRPTNGTAAKGFVKGNTEAFQQRPLLIVRYRRAGAAQPDTARLVGTVEAFVAQPKNQTWKSDTSRLFIQSGVATRSTVEFRIENVPANVSIHRAILELTLDAASSRLNTYSTDSLHAYYISDDGTFERFVALGEPESRAGLKVYRFNLSSLVQLWFRSNEKRRVTIGGRTEASSLDRFVLYGSAAPESLRPTLIITYSPVQ
jgi:hypothetical protein